jgi:hypothetical protein
MWKCQRCGKQNQPNRQHCWHCGTKDDGTPPDNPSIFALPSDSRLSAAADVLRPGVAESADSLPGSSNTAAADSASDSREVRNLLNRYWDAYTLARITVGAGEVVKVAGIVIGVVMLLAFMFLAALVNEGKPVVFIVGLIAGTYVAGQFYLFGMIIAAQGQILKASLDSAVNSSTFLNNTHRAKIMSL